MKKNLLLCFAMFLAFIFLSSIARSEIPDSGIEEESEQINLVEYYKNHPDELYDRIKPFTEERCLAGIADAIAPNSDDICKIAVMDCVMNRVHANGFPNSITEVCNQKNQWGKYDPKKDISDSSLRVARKYLNKIDELRISPICRDMTYIRVAEGGLYFRSSWEVKDEIFVSYYSA